MKPFRILLARAPSRPRVPSSTSARTATFIAGAGVIGTLIGASLSSLVAYWTNERQMDVKMVEIGVGILRAEPNQDVAAMRSWAIDLVEASSRRKFPPEMRAALLHKALPGSDYTWSAPGLGPRARAIQEKLREPNLSASEKLDLQNQLQMEIFGLSGPKRY